MLFACSPQGAEVCKTTPVVATGDNDRRGVAEQAVQQKFFSPLHFLFHQLGHKANE